MKTTRPPPRAASEIMTLQQVAEYLACHYSTIFRLLKKHEIPAFRVGSDWRFRRSDIEQWIHDREIKPKNHEYKLKGPRPKSRP
jgi:excisionase family DNA binding protein